MDSILFFFNANSFVEEEEIRISFLSAKPFFFPRGSFHPLVFIQLVWLRFAFLIHD